MIRLARPARLLPRRHGMFNEVSVLRRTRIHYQYLHFKSDLAVLDSSSDNSEHDESCAIRRLQSLRNVGIFAHVDAGKTTVTEHLLERAGVVSQAGHVDDGSTVTDYLPMEQERGITIQSAAISFDWQMQRDGRLQTTTITLIDTPGHIDFSVDVIRSVAVLDGALLVLDAVAGVQAQTETVWQALVNSSSSSSSGQNIASLPVVAIVNKMDKAGCHLLNVMKSMARKLPRAQPLPLQLPIFCTTTTTSSRRSLNSKSSGVTAATTSIVPNNLVTFGLQDDHDAVQGNFVGVVDLVHMRAVVWPQHRSTNADVAPTIYPLVDANGVPLNVQCDMTRKALHARHELVENLAMDDAIMEEHYMHEQPPLARDLTRSLRNAVLSQRIVPVLMSAAVQGRGLEPILDAIVELLPSPLDRPPPTLTRVEGSSSSSHAEAPAAVPMHHRGGPVELGHPLHPSLLALAFKVVHMKGRGGSGDGRVVFCRVYSGELRDRDAIQVLSAAADSHVPRTERIGGMLELAGGRFANLPNGVCQAGDVCALVGLKSVVTGDTILAAATRADKKHNKMDRRPELLRLAGMTPPAPVLTVRLEAESQSQEAQLSAALRLLTVEDPSLVVEENSSALLLSGLGELHIEVTLDRLRREYGLHVLVGQPSVSYREAVEQSIDSAGLIKFERIIGDVRMQAAVHVVIEPMTFDSDNANDPIVIIGPDARAFLGIYTDMEEDELRHQSDIVRALIEGCQGALKRGPCGSYELANACCRVVAIEADGGLKALEKMPGALRAAAAHAVNVTLTINKDACTVLEPTMRLEISAPNDLVGHVLSDLTSRRGTIDEVTSGRMKTHVQANVPLVEILGYANTFRSLTGGEGTFSAEYSGHTAC